MRELALAGVEGLHGPTKYNGLAESGAVLDPYIICKDLRDCPTGAAAPPRSGRGGSQVQILPLRPAFLTREVVTGNDMGDETYRHESFATAAVRRWLRAFDYEAATRFPRRL